MSDTSPNSERLSVPVGNNQEFLAFTLGEEEYALDIHKVQELRGYSNVTRIANTPDFIKGVVNLRDKIVPIIDMRIKLYFEAPTYNEFTVVIVLNLNGREIGMVVDSVSDVIDLSPGQIKPAPDIRSAFGTDYVIGIGTVGDRMLILIDVLQLMSSTELGLFEKWAA